MTKTGDVWPEAMTDLDQCCSQVSWKHYLKKKRNTLSSNLGKDFLIEVKETNISQGSSLLEVQSGVIFNNLKKIT